MVLADLPPTFKALMVEHCEATVVKKRVGNLPSFHVLRVAFNCPAAKPGNDA